MTYHIEVPAPKYLVERGRPNPLRVAVQADDEKAARAKARVLAKRMVKILKQNEPLY